MITGGWIKLNRSLLEWRWYQDVNTTRLWIHLLLRANYEDRPFRDFMIHRGETAASLPTLAEETGLSVRSVRTALSHLEETGDLTRRRHGQITVISIPNYDLYQRDLTDDRQSVDSPSTDDRQRWKKDKKVQEGKKTRAKRAASPSGSLYMRAVEWQREAEEEMAAEEAAEAAEDEE